MPKATKILLASIAIVALAIACSSGGSGDNNDDNNNDTTTDAGTPAGTEDTDAKCSDQVDNDGDGHVDCDDYSCTRNAAVTICPNAVVPEATAELCRNGTDDDGDGYTDCFDRGCTTLDGGDTGCIVKEVEKENTDALCNDGISNDGDQYVDCADYDCTKTAGITVCADAGTGPVGTDGGTSTGTPENTDALCSDGVSNDGDRFVDCDDYDCSKGEAVTVCKDAGN